MEKEGKVLVFIYLHPLETEDFVGKGVKFNK
jgi:hypothetical protein